MDPLKMRDFGSFLDYEKQKAIKVAQRVAADPYIFAALKNWQFLTAAEKKDFFSDYARIYAREAGLGIISLEEYQRPPTGGYVEFGHLAAKGGWLGGSALRMNTHPDVLAMVDVNKNINTISHELTHKYQEKIIEDPELLPHRFRATVPPIFKDNDAHYISSKQDYERYLVQPLERHAFIVGALVSQTVMEFIASHQAVRYPTNEDAARAQFDKGFVSISHSNFIEDRDPYRHFYHGLLQEGKLARRADREIWDALVRSYKSALKYGEYLVPYDPTIPLDKLGHLAMGMLDVEIKGQDKVREIKVPEHIQRQALAYLRGLRQSKRSAVRIRAEGLVRKAEKWVEATRPSGGETPPLAEYRA